MRGLRTVVPLQQAITKHTIIFKLKEIYEWKELQ